MPERPREMRIREAEGGFVIHCEGPGMPDKPKIASGIASVTKILKEYFGDSKSDEKVDE